MLICNSQSESAGLKKFNLPAYVAVTVVKMNTLVQVTYDNNNTTTSLKVGTAAPWSDHKFESKYSLLLTRATDACPLHGSHS